MSDEYVLESRRDTRWAPSSLPAAPEPLDPELERAFKNIPDKMAFKIGEVARIVGVKPYVLRYWETEFDTLRPKKSKHNQRMYERRDVETLLLIKKLLYKDRFSIEGARAALRKTRKDTQRAKAFVNLGEQIEDVKLKVEDVLDGIARLREMIRGR